MDNQDMRILLQEVHRRDMALLLLNPASPTIIRQKLGLKRVQTAYHLRILRTSGIIERLPKRRSFFGQHNKQSKTVEYILSSKGKEILSGLETSILADKGQIGYG